jgi:hypothetical protein
MQPDRYPPTHGSCPQRPGVYVLETTTFPVVPFLAIHQINKFRMLQTEVGRLVPLKCHTPNGLGLCRIGLARGTRSCRMVSQGVG